MVGVVLAPAAIISALVALAFLMAYGQFRDVIHDRLHFDVGIGPFSVDLFGWVVDAVDYLYAVILAVVDDWTHPLVNFILSPVAAIENTFTATRNAIAQLSSAVYGLSLGALPLALNQAVDIGNTGFLYLISQIEQLAQDTLARYYNTIGVFSNIVNISYGALQIVDVHLQAEIDAITGGAAIDVGTVTNIATNAAGAVVSAAIGPLRDLIDTDYANAISNAANLFQHAELDIASAVATAETYTDAAIAGIGGIDITDIDAEIVAGLTAIWPDIAAVIPELEGVIGTGDIDILDALGRIDWTIPANLAAVASLVGVTTLTMARFLRDCGVPNCKNLSALGNDLQSLFGLVGDAAFLAFIVGLIHDPEGAADTVASTVGGVIGEAVDLTRNLVGI